MRASGRRWRGRSEHQAVREEFSHQTGRLALRLFGADRAERLRLAYEARAERRADARWDLHALASYNDSWPLFILVQLNGRTYCRSM